MDDLADTDNDIKSNSDNDEEVDKNNECNKDTGLDAKSGKSARLLKKTNKKSVQFADGIKPGEGTSPSGGEGDMPSPPPPKRTDLREGLKDLRKDKIYSSRKSRKQEKRTRLPKTKKKVKVHAIYCSLISRKFKEKKKYFLIVLLKTFFLLYFCR